jgi:hypothetical protein
MDRLFLMGRSSLLLLVTLSLLLTGIAPVSGNSIESTELYEIPRGIINIIRRSEDIDYPFHNLLEEEYPLFEVNYTVPQDGWLEIGIDPVNDTLPEILVNGEDVYTRKTPFWREMVYEGEFFELMLYPTEHLNHTFSVVQEDVFVTIFEVYTWPDLVGNLTFSLAPREVIDPSFTWTSENQVGETALIFIPKWGDFEIVDYNWLLKGERIELEKDTTRLETPVLQPGEYTVTLTVIDEFGYTASSKEIVAVEFDPVDTLYDPALTEITVKDVQYPSSAGVNELVELVFGLDYSCPVPRDVRVDFVDIGTGNVLASLEDHMNGEGTKYYSISLATSIAPVPMSISIEPSFLNGEEWVKAVESSFVIQLTAPVEASGAVPGFTFVGVLMGIMGLTLLKRWLMVRSVPSPY